MFDLITVLGDVIDPITVEEPSTAEAVAASGAAVFFGLAAVLAVAAVVLVIVNIAKRTKNRSTAGKSPVVDP